MSDDDIRRIADAIEKMVERARNQAASETIADVHQNYADHIKAIFDGGHDDFTVFKAFRAMELMARQTAIQLRDN